MRGAALSRAPGVIPVHAFVRKFVRENDGVWRCVEAGELVLPAGRIQVAIGTRFTRGTRFMGVDVAQLLDEHYERHKPAA